jgi:hypothetical protein
MEKSRVRFDESLSEDEYVEHLNPFDLRVASEVNRAARVLQYRFPGLNPRKKSITKSGRMQGHSWPFAAGYNC